MNTHLPDDFIELLEELVSETLNDSGRVRLMAMITDRPDLQSLVTSQFAVSRALSQLDSDGDAFVALTASHVAKIAAEEASAFPQRVRLHIARRRIWKGLAVAALVTLGVLPFVPNKPSGLSPVAGIAGPDVGQFLRMGEGSQVSSTGSFTAGATFSEISGLMRFVFNNGAVVSVEAPSRITILSSNEMVLESGRLNAWCPDSAHGFKVRTASGSLTDLGTSFGIHVTPQHSEFLVLYGLVEVEKGSEKITVSQGNALEATHSTPLVPVAFAPLDFKRTWALTYGILSTRGAAVPADPDVLEKLIDLEDDDNLLVIPECRGVLFDSPVKAEVVGPGTLPEDISDEVKTLQPVPGKRLSSFVIRYNPLGIVTEEHFKRFEGEVTFDRPVLAIAGQRGTLENGDAMFATGFWNKDFRGIELSQYFNPPDSVTLSPDRRTVKVVFYAGASTDDVRVILEDN